MPWLKRHFPDLDLDSPEANARHRELIRSKRPLRRWYEAQYAKFAALAAGRPGGLLVELGSGGGFAKDAVPGLVTSSPLEADVKAGRVDRLLDAQALALPDASVDAFLLLDVLHHVRDARACLLELSRCLKPGGAALIIEPANTLFSSQVYKRLHHEAFDETAPEWGHAHPGPLAQANQAVPSNIFERDRARFERELPELRIESIRKHTFLSYPLSGGLSYEPLVPAAAEPLVALVEAAAAPLMRWVGLYMDVTLRRRAP